VFDFIRENIAEQIFNSMVASVLLDLKGSQNIDISIDPLALQTLRDLCLKDLSNGGRGIRNKIETHLVNPLSRALFDENIEAGSRLSIRSVETGKITKLRLATESATL
jgi:ATP-dependent Clp protease ATP-binding subunit ClpA